MCWGRARYWMKERRRCIGCLRDLYPALIEEQHPIEQGLPGLRCKVAGQVMQILVGRRPSDG